jgi:hypothetical protein
VSLLLVAGLLGRGHTLQALGVPLACEHPAQSSAQGEDQHGAMEKSAGENCPSDCHDCACGQIPMMLPACDAVLYAVLAPYELDEWTPLASPGLSLRHRLDRPPRHPGA